MTTGRIVGRVIDAVTGQGIVDVGVQVVGTTIGVSTGLDGRFSCPTSPPARSRSTCAELASHRRPSPEFFLEPARHSTRTSPSRPQPVELTTQVVTASSERGTVKEALDKQRTAVGVVNSVTAEQIARVPTAMLRRRCSA